jgi:hypothetical protein
MNSAVSPTDKQQSNEVYIAGIFDLNSYDWGADIFNFTVKLINEGWCAILCTAIDCNDGQCVVLKIRLV